MGRYTVSVDGRRFELEFELPAAHGQEFAVRVNGEPLRLRIPAGDGIEWILVNDRPCELHLDGSLRFAQTREDMHEVGIEDRDTGRARPASVDGRLLAPIPGTIARVLARAGETVVAGQPLLVLEAMKMENEVKAPRAGTLGAVHVEPGRVVKRGELLAEVI